MLSEYIFYYGALFHQLLVGCNAGLCIEPYDHHGRPNSFVVDNKVGLFIKHSAKRLSPWTFTFTLEHMREIESLCKRTTQVFICLICADDGIACLGAIEFIGLIGGNKSDQTWVRLYRRPNEMYRVTGSANELSRRLSRGILPVTDALGKTIPDGIFVNASGETDIHA